MGKKKQTERWMVIDNVGERHKGRSGTQTQTHRNKEGARYQQKLKQQEQDMFATGFNTVG